MRLKLNGNSCLDATPGSHSRAGSEIRFSGVRPAFATKQRRESGCIMVTVGKKA